VREPPARRSFFTVIIMQRSRAIPPFASLMLPSPRFVRRGVACRAARRPIVASANTFHAALHHIFLEYPRSSAVAERAANARDRKGSMTEDSDATMPERRIPIRLAGREERVPIPDRSQSSSFAPLFSIIRRASCALPLGIPRKASADTLVITGT